jgi:putative ABC transport system ATP-binding protein
VSAKKPLIYMKGINKHFVTDSTSAPVLDNIDLKVFNGDYVSVSGPSGCGKSTLLSIVGLLDRPTSGVYEISDTNITELTDTELARVRNREIGFIFQDFNLIGDMTVFQNVELTLIYRGIEKSKRKEMVLNCLKKVNMEDRSSYLPTQLSGGQQQRVAVARAIVGKPSLILADEPTGNLDSKNGDAVMQLLTQLNQEGSTIFMVTHDSRYSDCATTSLHLFDGSIVSETKTDQSLNPTENPASAATEVS